MCRDEVVRILDQLVLGQRIDQTCDGACADEGKYQAADALDQRMSPFQQDTDLKKLMDAAFVHAFLERASNREQANDIDGSGYRAVDQFLRRQTPAPQAR